MDKLFHAAEKLYFSKLERTSSEPLWSEPSTTPLRARTGLPPIKSLKKSLIAPTIIKNYT